LNLGVDADVDDELRLFATVFSSSLSVLAAEEIRGDGVRFFFGFGDSFVVTSVNDFRWFFWLEFVFDVDFECAVVEDELDWLSVSRRRSSLHRNLFIRWKYEDNRSYDAEF